MRTFLLGGLMPILAFTVVEEMWGLACGVIVAMVYGACEIAYEKFYQGKIQALTLWSNGFILALGASSLLAGEGIWFKLQPTLLEGTMALLLWGMAFRGRNIFVWLAEQQGRSLPPALGKEFLGISVRVGFFLFLHAVLSAWAALYWTTAQWALLKGVGFTGSLLAYLFAEFLVLRRRSRN